MSAFVNAKTVLCAALLALGLGAAPVLSEETAAPPDPQKVALIKQLLDASKTSRNAQLGFDTMLDQQMHFYQSALNDRIDQNPKLSDEQKTAAKRVAMSSYSKRVARLKELFAQQVDITKLVNDSYIKQYDKHFTTAEIQDLLTFYNSPTGQKALDVLPQITQEMMVDVNKVVIPKMKDIDAQIMADEKSGKFNQ